MSAPELGVELALLRKEVLSMEQLPLPKRPAHYNEARNRLNMVIGLYSARTGRSWESVQADHGVPYTIPNIPPEIERKLRLPPRPENPPEVEDKLHRPPRPLGTPPPRRPPSEADLAAIERWAEEITEDDPSAVEMKERLRRSIVEPVMRNLTAHVRADAPDALPFLSSLDVRLANSFRAKPDAQAFQEDGRNIVELNAIDAVLRDGLFDVAALMLFRVPDSSGGSAAEIARKIGEQYGRACGAARLAGARVPRLRFNSQALGISNEYMNALRVFKAYVMEHYVSFAVLHEVGHHVLRHLGGGTVSPARARNLEFAADAWAFDTLVKLDYSLPILQAFFLAQSLEDGISGLAGPQTTVFSRHPPWADRLARLSDVMTRPAPVRTAYAMYEVGIGFTDASGTRKFGALQLAVPASPTARRAGAAVIVDPLGKTLGAAEFGGRGAIIYAADPNGDRVQFNLESVEDFETRVTRHQWQAGNHTQQSFLAFRGSFSHVNDMPVYGTTVRAVMQVDPLTIALRALDSAAPNEAARVACGFLIGNAFDEQGRVMLSYHKGRLAQARAVALVQQNSVKLGQNLTEWLGADGYRRFQTAAQDSPMMKEAMGLLKGQAP